MDADQQDHLPRQPTEVRVFAAVPQTVRQEAAPLPPNDRSVVQLFEGREGEEGQEEEEGVGGVPGHQDQGEEAERGGAGVLSGGRVQSGVPGGEAAQGEEEEEEVEAQEAEEAPQKRVQRFQLHFDKLALLSHHSLALT